MNAVAQAAPFRREPDSGIVAGVLSGLAHRIGTDPLLVRILFVIAVFLSGGLILLGYALAWAVVPAEGAPATRETRRIRALAHPGWRVAAGAALLTLSALLAFRQLGIWWSDALVWPLVLAAGGAAVLWRQSRALAEPDGRRSPSRHGPRRRTLGHHPRPLQGRLRHRPGGRRRAPLPVGERRPRRSPRRGARRVVAVWRWS